MAIVLGGDGSILRAAHQMGDRQLPVIAVNLGKLGFLADLSPEELPRVLRDYRAGKVRVVEHLMFECELVRDGDVLDRAVGTQRGRRSRTGPRSPSSTSIFTLTQNW